MYYGKCGKSGESLRQDLTSGSDVRSELALITKSPKWLSAIFRVKNKKKKEKQRQTKQKQKCTSKSTKVIKLLYFPDIV